jgi:hypothetical protein
MGGGGCDKRYSPNQAMSGTPTTVMRHNLLIPFLYFFLAFCGLGIPLAHRQFGEQIIMASGTVGGLHEGVYIGLRAIGFLAWFLPLPGFLAGSLSICFEKFRSLEGICFIAMAMFICSSVDAIYCLFLLHSAVGA